MEKKLKVLFITSGNSKNFEITPFIKSQGDSLLENNIIVDYFLINGRGIKGYLLATKDLRKKIKEQDFDIIHAHYSLCALTAILALPKIPVVVSLMGTDAYGEYIGENKVKLTSYYLTFITFLIQPFVQAIICKSLNIEKFVYLKKKSNIIPNGVNTDLFKDSGNKTVLRKELGLNLNKQLVLFLGNKNDPRKNFVLINESVKKLTNDNIEIIAPFPVSPQLIPKYLNACDVFVMPAFMEGSPNVIKEAMACNCPIVSTDVGDVNWVMGDTEGCFLSDFSAENFSRKLKQALEFSKEKNRTVGRNRVFALGINIEAIAKRISELYSSFK